MNAPRARVFVSCGQHGTEEVETARELGRILREEFGYEDYIASEQLSLQGVKEAIFPQLRESEYLLFVDLPREELSGGTHRGSLFSHQELAVAAYLDMPYIGFRHKAVRLEGLAKFLLSNMPGFEHQIELPKLLRMELARRADWRPDWKNRLLVCRPDPNEGADMRTGTLINGAPVAAPVRYFHLRVANLHRDRMALGCTAYVEKVTDARTGAAIEFKPTELKWAGTPLPSVPIPAGGARELDACRIWAHDPSTIDFGSLSDSGRYMAPITGRTIDVTYVVLSENLPAARCTLSIEPGVTPQAARVRGASDE